MDAFKDIIDLMKTEALVDKTKVMKAQEKFLECLDMWLNSVTGVQGNRKSSRTQCKSGNEE